jgi:hypothetical protein
MDDLHVVSNHIHFVYMDSQSHSLPPSYNITHMTVSEFQKWFGQAGLPSLYPHPLVIVASDSRNE